MKTNQKRVLLLVTFAITIIAATAVIYPRVKRSQGIDNIRALISSDPAYEQVHLYPLLTAPGVKLSKDDPTTKWVWSLDGKVRHMYESERLLRIVVDYGLLPYTSYTVQYELEN
ncbi:MAG TPA: hypothetical protein PKE17_19580 [Saprospiraceae bacterium]|nr:hypothetical protein [Saprospiraceae bacterium]